MLKVDNLALVCMPYMYALCACILYTQVQLRQSVDLGGGDALLVAALGHSPHLCHIPNKLMTDKIVEVCERASVCMCMRVHVCVRAYVLLSVSVCVCARCGVDMCVRQWQQVPT